MTDGTSGPTEPNWLIWARQIQALAQTGLAFTRDEYNRARYRERFRPLAAQIMAQHTGLEVGDIEVMFTQRGPAMPRRRWTYVVRCSATAGYLSSVRRLTGTAGRYRAAGPTSGTKVLPRQL